MSEDDHFDLEHFGEHGHMKPMEAYCLHIVCMREKGITDPDEVVAAWNRRDPDAPWLSHIVGEYIKYLTGIMVAFMEGQIENPEQ